MNLVSILTAYPECDPYGRYQADPIIKPLFKRTSANPFKTILPPILFYNHSLLVDTKEVKEINSRYSFLNTIYNEPACATRVDVYIDSQTGAKLIIKRVNKKMLFTPENVESAYREVQIHMSLSHPNIVDMYDSGDTGTEILHLMEYLPAGSYFSNKIELVSFYIEQRAIQLKTRRRCVQA